MKSALWRILYITMLLALVLWVWTSLARFEGYVRVELGRPEHVAFTPLGEAPWWRARLAAPAQMIPFDNPNTATRLKSDSLYVPLEMPLWLQLDAAEPLQEIPPRDVLQVQMGAQGENLELRQGEELPGLGLRVKSIRPWRGLLAHPRGLRSARVVLEHENREEAMLLEAERWVIPSPDVALLLRWHASPEAARQAAAQVQRPGMRSAWWTVREGEGELRFNNLAPGAGAELDDGTVWTVERLDEEAKPPVLVLRVEKAGQGRLVELAANQRNDESRAHFHAPGAAHSVVYLDAWQDGQALATILQDKARERVQMKLGTPQEVSTGVELFVVQLLAYGLPASTDEAELQEVVLEAADGARIYLQESQSQNLGPRRLTYRREAPEPPRRLFLQARGQEGEGRELVLEPEGHARVDGWVLEQEETDDHQALLRVRRTPFNTVALAGLALFSTGAYGWALAGLLRARKGNNPPS